ncbi:MAG: FeoB-associated Cys-rich membrane protein [Actinomycetota bacterium]
MNIQSIIVGIILLAAFIYVGNILRQKVKSFKPKDASCGADCGCGAKEKNEAVKI